MHITTGFFFFAVAIRTGPVGRLVFAIHTGLFRVCVNIEYAQANSFVVVFMVDFAPFSAVLVNCQFYRLNNITFFFSW